MEVTAKQYRKICAWCGKDLGPADTDADSHGICQACSEELLKGVEVRKLSEDEIQRMSGDPYGPFRMTRTKEIQEDE